MIILDERLKKTLEEHLKKHKKEVDTYEVPVSIYFMVGSFFEQYDIQVAHYIRCPLPKNKGPKDTNSLAVRHLETNFILSYANQILRMLPGGVDIVGILIISDEHTTFPPLKSLLLDGLQHIARLSTTATTYDLFEYITHMALIQIDELTGNDQSFLFEIGEKAGSCEPTKFQYEKLEWASIVSRVGGRISDHLPLKNDDLGKDLSEMMVPWAERLLECDFILMDGAVRKGVDDLNTDLVKNKKTSFEIALVVKSECDDHCETTLTPESASNWHDYVFDVEIRAAIPIKSKVDDAFVAIKKHIYRNFWARNVFLCDLMSGNQKKAVEDGQEHFVVSISAIAENGEVYQMPRPATTTLPYHSSILFSDWLFEADSIEDSQKKIKEMLDIDVSIEHVDDGWERSLESAELDQVRAPGVVPDHLPLITSIHEKASNRRFYIIIFVSIIMGIISWIMYKMMA